MLSYIPLALLATGAVSRSLNMSLVPSTISRRDNECNQGDTKISDDGGVICYSYCENSSTQITGDPVVVGSDINCDTAAGCSAQHSEATTVTQSFSINIGASGDTDPGEDDVLKGGASIGASWSWSTANANTDTWTFDLSDGDVGHVVFRPYFQQSCGDLAYFSYDCSDDYGDACSCDTTPYAEDTNACGNTPIMNGNFADGEFTFCYTGGPNAGTGC